MSTGDVYHYRDWTWGIIQGNNGTFGTGGLFADTTLVSTASVQIPTDVDIEITKNVNTRRPNRANSYRQPVLLDATQDGKGVAPTLKWNTEFTKEHGDYLLSGLFQRCTEGATTPYVKTFRWPTSSTTWTSTTGYGYPNFEDNEGYYYGFVSNHSVSTLDKGIISCVPTDVTFSIDSTPQNNQLKFSSNWVGRIVQPAPLTATVPTAYTALSYFSFDDMVVTVFSGAMYCYGWSLTITPGFTQIPGGGTSCQDIAMGPHKVTGYIDILWNATTRAIFEDLQTDTNGNQTGPITIGWGSGADPVTTSGDLLFKLNAQFTGHQNQGNEERIIRLQFECVEDVVGNVRDCEIQMANAIDRAWQG
jgi:hypothetical protein